MFLDYDGTLSHIVLLPSQAGPAAGVPEVLASLSERVAILAIISGRGTRELVDWLGDDIAIWGVHGTEHARGGAVEVAPRVKPYLDTMQLVLDEARAAVHGAAIPGLIVEDKRVVVALHFRAAADRDEGRAVMQRIAESLAAKHDLVIVEGRAVFELRPPIEMTKASVLLDCAEELDLQAVLFAGDDTVDVPGFDALDELSARSDHTQGRGGVTRSPKGTNRSGGPRRRRPRWDGRAPGGTAQT